MISETDVQPLIRNGKFWIAAVLPSDQNDGPIPRSFYARARRFLARSLTPALPVARERKKSKDKWDREGERMSTKGLLVASQIDHTVREYDRTTGAFVKVAASSLGDPLGLVIGLDGNLLVS